MTDIRYGFLGAGHMAEALVSGILRNSLAQPDSVKVCDISTDRLQWMNTMYRVTSLSLEELVEWSDVLVLAIKPQSFETLCSKLNACFREKLVYVSIMAGVPLSVLKHIGSKAKLIRVMPNTPALIGQGMSVLSSSDGLSQDARDSVESCFKSVGQTLWLDEASMDVVTAVSGSGPAYLFRLAEAMVKGAMDKGLSLDVAEVLVKQTFKGASDLMLDSTQTPAELRVQVSSPGGTTLAGLDVFEKADLDQIVGDVLEAAKLRSEELGRG